MNLIFTEQDLAVLRNRIHKNRIGSELDIVFLETFINTQKHSILHTPDLSYKEVLGRIRLGRQGLKYLLESRNIVFESESIVGTVVNAVKSLLATILSPIVTLFEALKQAGLLVFDTVSAIFGLIADTLTLVRNFITSVAEIPKDIVLYVSPYIALDITVTALDYGLQDAEEILKRKKVPSVSDIRVNEKLAETIKQIIQLPGFRESFRNVTDKVKGLRKETLSLVEIEEKFVDYLFAKLMTESAKQGSATETKDVSNVIDHLTSATDNRSVVGALAGIIASIVLAPKVAEHATWILKRANRLNNVPLALVLSALIGIWFLVHLYILQYLYSQFFLLPDFLGIALSGIVTVLVIPSLYKLAVVFKKASTVVVKNIKQASADELNLVIYSIRIAIKKHVWTALKEYKHEIVKVLKGKP